LIRIQGRLSRPLASLLAGGLAFAALSAADAQGESQPQVDDGKTVSAAPQPRHPREKTYMKRQWGIEVLFVRQTSAGYMLEFRYKVLDPEKAIPLFERQTKPVLTHVETGARMIVPTPAKTGALRNSNAPLAGHTYWMFFANPGKFVEQGDAVSIDIGEFHVEGLIVE
jgi:hypothetical protein